MEVSVGTMVVPIIFVIHMTVVPIILAIPTTVVPIIFSLFTRWLIEQCMGQIRTGTYNLYVKLLYKFSCFVNNCCNSHDRHADNIGNRNDRRVDNIC